MTMKSYGKHTLIVMLILAFVIECILITGCRENEGSNSLSGEKLLSETVDSSACPHKEPSVIFDNHEIILNSGEFQLSDLIDDLQNQGYSFVQVDINKNGREEVIITDGDGRTVLTIYAQIDGDVQVVFSDLNDASSLTYITKKGRFVNEYAFNGTNREYVLTEICFDVNYKQIFKAGYRAEFTMDVDLYKNPDIHEDGLNYYYEIYDNNRINTRNKITQESWMVGVEQLLSIEAQSFVPQWCLR